MEDIIGQIEILLNSRRACRKALRAIGECGSDRSFVTVGTGGVDIMASREFFPETHAAAIKETQERLSQVEEEIYKLLK